MKLMKTFVTSFMVLALACASNLTNTFAADVGGGSNGDYGIMPVAATGGATIQNTAKIVSENGEVTDISSGTAETLITKSVLSIKKELLSEDIRVGDEIEYKITISNTGDAEARNVKVEDELNPAQVEFISATNTPEKGISYEKNTQAYEETIKWTITNINPDESTELRLKVKVKKGVETGTVIKNSAEITEENGKPEQPPISSDSDPDGSPEFTVVAPDLSVTKTVDKESARAGDTLKYTIVIKNDGTGTARNFSVEDAVSNLVDIQTGSFTTTDDTVTHSEVGNKITWSVPKLAPSGTITITFNVTIK